MGIWYDTGAEPRGIREEIAGVWGLPLGERVRVSVLGQERMELRGCLKLVSDPGYPWDKREPLHLEVAGVRFSSAEIASWSLL